jgi:hypothetical protein
VLETGYFSILLMGKYIWIDTALPDVLTLVGVSFRIQIDVF